MKRSYRTIPFVLVVTAATLGFSSIASAQADDSDYAYRKVEVSYTDLNLRQASDAQALYDRITSAARKACKQDNGVAFRSAVFNECVGKAVDGAVQNVGHENLTAIHRRDGATRSVVAASR
jgi:UrcA family protein